MRDGVRQCFARLRTDGPGDRLDVKPPGARRDADGAGAARHRQRRLECPCGKLDTIRRQLCDSVRDDRAREVDRLAACASKQKLCDAHILSLPKVRMARDGSGSVGRCRGGRGNRLLELRAGLSGVHVTVRALKHAVDELDRGRESYATRAWTEALRVVVTRRPY